MVSDSVSKTFGIEKSIGFGIVKIWYWKKYRIRYRKNLVSKKYRIRYQKNLVSEKVSVSVSKKFGVGEKFRIWFRSGFGYRHTLPKRLFCQKEQIGKDNILSILLNSFLPKRKS